MEHDEPIGDRISFVNFSFQIDSDLIRASIQRDCGLYYKRRNMISKALHNFTDSLGYNSDSVQSKLQELKCNLELCNIMVAIDKGNELQSAHPDRIDVQYAYEQCKYDQNEFERCLAACRNVEHQFRPTINLPILGPSLATKTINQSIGLESGPCLFKLQNQIDQYVEHKAACRPENLALWKHRLANKECDVVSVDEPEKIFEGPLGRIRVAQKRKLMNTVYLGSNTAEDIEFLRKLRNDPRLTLRHTVDRAKSIQDLIDTNDMRVATWKTQLWHRKPLYAHHTSSVAFRKATLYRRQYQTRRDIYQQLVYIRNNINTNFQTTLHYIEEMMSKYYSIKTLRVCPRKAEFVTDIFNLVGQTLLRRECVVPSDLMTVPVVERLAHLLQIPEEKKEPVVDTTGPTYGDRSRFIDPDASDMIIMPYMKRIRTLELQLKHSNFPEERCYLCYQIVDLHLIHRRMREAVEYSRRLLDDARGNDPWTLIGYLSAIRSDVISLEYRKAGKKIENMLNSSALSKNDDMNMHHFWKVIQMLNIIMLKEECMTELLLMNDDRSSAAGTRTESGTVVDSSILQLKI